MNKNHLISIFFKELNKIKYFCFLIISVSIFFFYISENSKHKLYKAEVLINSYNDASKILEAANINYKNFYETFLFQLSSYENFFNYIHKNEKEKFTILNKFIKSEGISVYEYLKKNFYLEKGGLLVVINKTFVPNVIFYYPENFPGNIVLNNYVKYSFKESINSLLELEKKILNFQNELSKQNNLLQENNIKLLNSESSDYEELKINFIQKISSNNQQILKNKVIIDFINKNNLSEKNNIILQSASNSTIPINLDIKISIIWGLLFGISISFLILIIKLFCQIQKNF